MTDDESEISGNSGSEGEEKPLMINEEGDGEPTRDDEFEDAKSAHEE